MTVEPPSPPTTDPAQTLPAPAVANGAAPSTDLMVSNAKGRTLLKTQRSSVLIGRHKDCHLSLDDDRASKAHAVLVCIDRQWHLADLFSTNGTQLNDRPVKNLERLHSGDRIRVGHIDLHVSFTERVDLQHEREAALAEIDARERQLQALETDLRTRNRVVDKRGDDLDQREAGVQGREADLERCVRRLVERREELTQRELSQATLESDLQAQAAELERNTVDQQHLALQNAADSQNLKNRTAQLQQDQDDWQAQLIAAQQEAQAATEVHTRRGAELDNRAEACQSHTMDLDRRVSQLDERQSSLEQTSERLAQQVKAHREAEACLQDQKKALHQTQEEHQRQAVLHLEKQNRHQVELEGRKKGLDEQEVNLTDQNKKLQKQRQKVTLMFHSFESILKALNARESTLNQVEQALHGKQSQQKRHQLLLAELASELERWRDTLGQHNGHTPHRNRISDTPASGTNSPLEVLRKLGATGTDEELTAKLAHNPLTLEPSPAAAPLQ